MGEIVRNRLKELDIFFVNKCKELFFFLEKEFDCKLSQVVKEWYGLILCYRNNTTAIQISIEERDGGIFVELSKLVNGKIPKKPIQINKNTKLNSFDLEDLLDVKGTFVKVEHPPLDDLVFNRGKERVIERVLSKYAESLKLYATDVLRGDFAIFSQLEKVVKARKQKKQKRGRC